MASQDQKFKYIGSLTEGPSLTSGCGMACCPWTAYACNKRKTTQEFVTHSHSPIFINPQSSARHKKKDRWANDRTPTTEMLTSHKSSTAERVKCEAEVLYLTTGKDDWGP